MTKRSADTVIITDLQAEGSPRNIEEREPASPSQTMFPVTHPSSFRRSPVAETGVVAAVVLHGEGADDSDTQDASRTVAETQTSPVSQTQTSTPVTALIVEDTPELADLLQITLRRMRIATVHESHGERASARFKELNPDVVLLDIGLPDIPGWKVLETIKERQKAAGEPMPIVIVITAYGDPANRLVGKLQGVYSYLIKPFTPHEVERIVRNALNSVTG